MTGEELIEFINEAFDGVPCPKITLHVAQAHDDRDYEHDIEHRKKDWIGSWQKIPDKDLYECPNALSYLEADGVRYYLPKIMTFVLENYNDFTKKSTLSLNYWIIESLIYKLCCKDKEFEGYTKEQFSLLNLNQKIACARFLKYLFENNFLNNHFIDEIIRGLDLRWGEYLR